MLALAVFAAVAASLVLSAYAQKFADPLAAEAEESALPKAQAESLAPEGGSFLLDGEGEFAIAQYSRATNGLRMT